MGMIDREDMSRRDADTSGSSPFTRPGEASATATLWIMLLVAAIAYGAYVGWRHWKSSSWSATPPSTPATPSTKIPPHVATPRAVVTAPAVARPTPTGNVVKCVKDGQTLYAASESDCAAHAKTTWVPINRHENVIESLPNSAQIIARPSPGPERDSIHSSAADTAPNNKAICQAYEEEIKWIDIRARQPLPGEEQDRLAARRKNARDQQFRLRC